MVNSTTDNLDNKAEEHQNRIISLRRNGHTANTTLQVRNVISTKAIQQRKFRLTGHRIGDPSRETHESEPVVIGEVGSTNQTFKVAFLLKIAKAGNLVTTTTAAPLTATIKRDSDSPNNLLKSASKKKVSHTFQKLDLASENNLHNQRVLLFMLRNA